MKREFILNEIWIMTCSAAFQRANIYALEAIDAEKAVFRNKLKVFIHELSKAYTSNSITETSHLKNTHSISTFSKQFDNLLSNGKLNFGISQKLLNLYLKYLWCIDILKLPPPHFPVDRIIQTKLKITNPFPWTQMIDETEYLKIIEKAKQTLSRYKVDNLAELELFLYSRH